jgi:ABC-type thiamin/hydroxymethylpyrimidine transport system permease subunit
MYLIVFVLGYLDYLFPNDLHILAMQLVGGRTVATTLDALVVRTRCSFGGDKCREFGI